MNYTGIFPYNPENLLLAHPSLESSLLWIAILAGIYIVVRWTLFLLTSIALIFADRRQLARKKQMLGDLIIMKDIQTELEKEIEQATLKAAFQN